MIDNLELNICDKLPKLHEKYNPNWEALDKQVKDFINTLTKACKEKVDHLSSRLDTNMIQNQIDAYESQESSSVLNDLQS